MVSQTTKGILSLISGFSLHLVLGSLYTWANILPYLGSKLHHYNPGTSLESTLFFIPINILATNLFMPLGGKLDKILNQRLLLLIGTLLIAGGNAICAFADGIFIVIIGDFIIGIGSGITYMTPIKNVWSYFPDYKGLVTGIISCGFGGSSFIFSFVSKALVNPTNEAPGPDGYYGPDVFDKVTGMFIWLGSIYTLLGLISVATFIQFKSEVTVTDLKNQLMIQDAENSEEKTDDPNAKETLGKALLSVRFFMLFLMPFLTSTYGFFAVNALKLFGKENNIDDSTLTLASSLAGLGNGISRPVWGIILDKWKFKKTYFFLCIVQVSLASTIYFTPLASGYMYVVWCFLSLCCEGSHFTIMPAVVRQVFGSKNATEIYGFVFFAYSGGSFIGPILTNYIVKGRDKIYYLMIYLIMAGFTVIAFFVCWCFNYTEFNYGTRHLKKGQLPDKNSDKSNDGYLSMEGKKVTS